MTFLWDMTLIALITFLWARMAMWSRRPVLMRHRIVFVALLVPVLLVPVVPLVRIVLAIFHRDLIIMLCTIMSRLLLVSMRPRGPPRAHRASFLHVVIRVMSVPWLRTSI